jgi:hypothetical protein
MTAPVNISRLRREIEQVRKSINVEGDEPPLKTIRVEFVEPVDGQYWESEDPGPRPPGRVVGGFTWQVGGRSSKQNGGSQ